MPHKAASPQRWFSGWRSTARSAQDDPADLGTAFGLDMSMIETPPEPPPAAERRPGWVRRLTLRRRSAT
jgi:hypothetical protein